MCARFESHLAMTLAYAQKKGLSGQPSGSYTPRLSGSAPRIASIDAFRGLTIFVMIFVNDLSGAANVPWWMKHIEGDADGMTFVDVVFPAFLFIVGLAMPFAFSRRMDRGEPVWKLLVHVLTRTIGLLIVGVFMVNMPADASATGMSNDLWTLLVFLCVILVWNIYPRSSGWKSALFWLLRAAGIGGLAYLAWRYRGSADGQIVRMRPQWWGILGIIGWAYLVAGILYLVFRNRIEAMMGALGLLTILYIADRSGAFRDLTFIQKYVGVGEKFGAHPSIVVAGMIVGLLFLPASPAQTPWQRIRWLLVFACGLAAGGFWLRPLYGISKNHATPAWCLLCSAICCVMYAFLYWLMDVKHVTRWAWVFRPAGENPLLAYILPTIFFAALYFWPNDPLETFRHEGTRAVVRSLIFSFAMVGLTGLLGKMRIRLRL